MSSFMVNVKLGSKQTIPLEVHNHDTVFTVKQQLCHLWELKPESVKFIFQGKLLPDTLTLEDTDLGENSTLHAVLQRQDASFKTPDQIQVLGGQAETMPNNLDLKGQISTSSCNLTDNADHLNPETDSLCHTSSTQLPELDLNLTDLEQELRHENHVDPDLTLPKEPISPHKRTFNLYYVYCKYPCQRLSPGRIRVRCATCKEGTIEMTQEPTCWQDVLKPGKINGKCLSENCTGNKAEFYFKCNSHMRSEGQESVAVLQNVTANLCSVPCLTCGDQCCPVLAFPCSRSHVMCLDCFVQYCNTKLDERGFIYSTQHGYTLGCPAGCKNSLIDDGHHFRLLGEQQYERYQRFAVEECLLREGGLMCPAPGCGEGLFPEEGTRRVQCARPECQFVFCRNCRQAYHETGECDVRSLSPDSNSRWFFERRVCDPHESMSLSTIAAISKPCPQCKVPVERSGGCMHMTCSRCGFQWCWLCQVAWSRDCQGNHWFGEEMI